LGGETQEQSADYKHDWIRQPQLVGNHDERQNDQNQEDILNEEIMHVAN
jgi:hypothetical protein